ncbi:hypothetical protein GCM10009682_23910 [Luedemannella flava]|uniref:Uncharacterized protein n=1 Tax=Luedemannella flava TaxID=349316 RepID=A0ABP4Y9W6_9ACTN
MVAVLADRMTADEGELVSIVATNGDPRYSVTAARYVIHSWCEWGLAHTDGNTITAVDTDSLREIAKDGWHRWLATHRPDLVSTGGIA